MVPRGGGQGMSSCVANSLFPMSAESVISRSWQARAQAALLYQASAALLERCQGTRADIYRGRLTCSTRRLMHVAGGGSSVSPTPDPTAARTIREKLRLGILPTETCAGGIVIARGDQQACSGCDRAIMPDEVEIRARYAGGGEI